MRRWKLIVNFSKTLTEMSHLNYNFEVVLRYLVISCIFSVFYGLAFSELRLELPILFTLWIIQNRVYCFLLKRTLDSSCKEFEELYRGLGGDGRITYFMASSLQFDIRIHDDDPSVKEHGDKLVQEILKG